MAIDAQCMKIPISLGKVKNTNESEMLIGTSRRENVINPLLFIVVLCGYFQRVYGLI